MKKLPEVNESFEEIYGMFTGLVRSKLLLAGIELKVFNYLTEPKSADAVAKAINAHPGNTRILLDGLATCDLVVKKKGLYRNTPAAQTFLAEGSPTYLGQVLSSMYEMGLWHVVLDDLPKLVKDGPPSFSPEADMGSEEMGMQLAATMAASERAGRAQQAAQVISGLPEFSSFK